MTEFKYEPLSSSSSIRLLELSTEGRNVKEPKIEHYPGFQPEDAIVCTTCTAEIGGPVAYDAVSYTWGNPRTIFESQDQADQAAKLHANPGIPILCNGMILRVGVNLHDMLLMLREARRRAQYTLRSLDISLPDAPLVPQYLWIDAICIDQGNIPEKNIQVQLMDRVYKTAEKVIIWLGQGDKFSPLAFKLVRVLRNAPMAKAKNFHLSDELLSADYASAGLIPVPPMAWLSLFALFERSWFQRAWIVQEAALSRMAIVFCGSKVIAWAALQQTATWLRESLVYGTVWKHGLLKAMPQHSPISGMYRVGVEIVLVERLTQNPVMTAFFISDVRARLGIQDSTLQLPNPPKAADLLSLLHTFRSSKCQDPRDKIYALLSLQPPEEVSSADCAAVVVADYTKPAHAVYLEAAWAILASTNDLRLLSYTESKNDGGIRLPSWVRDWTSGLELTPFDQLWLKDSKNANYGDRPYNASGGTTWQKIIPSDRTSPLLNIQGVLVGKINRMANVDDPYSGPSIAFLNDIPCLYEYISFEPGNKSPHSAAGELEPVVEDLSLGDSMLHIPDNGHSQSTTPLKTQSGAASRPKIVQTRVEAIWRTLLADVWDYKHPAPLEAGSAFVGSLIEEVHRLHAKIYQSSRNGPMKLTASDLFDYLQGLTGMMGPSPEAPKQALDENLVTLLALAADEQRAFEAHGEGGKDVMALNRFVPPFQTWEDVLSYRDIDQRATYLWKGQQRRRCLFSTTCARLGLGPNTSKPEDEIWVVRGAQFPCVLRLQENGNRQWVGEAYVHGIMNGQAIHPIENVTWTDLVIE